MFVYTAVSVCMHSVTPKPLHLDISKFILESDLKGRSLLQNALLPLLGYHLEGWYLYPLQFFLLLPLEGRTWTASTNYPELLLPLQLINFNYLVLCMDFSCEIGAEPTLAERQSINLTIKGALENAKVSSSLGPVQYISVLKIYSFTF